MKTKNIIAIILFLCVMLGVWKFREQREAQHVRALGGLQMPDFRDTRTREQILADRLEEKKQRAESQLIGLITNTTGYRRHTGLRIIDFDTNHTAWSASVSVETINRIGGVDSEFRTYKYQPERYWLRTH